jgi:HEPN domain-containing protein
MDHMNDACRAWIERAEAHFATAVRESTVLDLPNPSAVIYHSHWCVQAYLRARLAEAAVPFPHTPYLVVLLYICVDMQPTWDAFREHLRTLTSHAMDARDATQSITTERVHESLDLCTAFRSEAKQAWSA